MDVGLAAKCELARLTGEGLFGFIEEVGERVI